MSQELTETNSQSKLPAENILMTGSIMSNPALFEHTWRVALAFSRSSLVPKALQGKPENCMVALDMARILGENPIIVLQNIYFVNDKAGWASQYLIGKVNRSGLIKGRITWKIEGKGDALKVTALAIDASTGEELSASADMLMAKAEGWTKNPKYASMPEHMLKYRSAAFLFRFHFPDVMFGLPTSDELEDMKYSGQIQDEDDQQKTQRKRRGAAAALVAEVIEVKTTEVQQPNDDTQQEMITEDLVASYGVNL